MSIGKRVAKLRKECGMTQSELARAVNVVPSMIAQVERDTKALTINLGLEIADVLKCSLMDIAKGE